MAIVMHPPGAAAASADPSVRVLGELELLGVNGPAALPRRKARQILVTLLAFPNQFVARDALIESLWLDDMPTDPLASTRSYVSMVRRALESAVWTGRVPQVVSQPSGITLCIDTEALDSTRFSRLVDRADTASSGGAFVEALELLDAALTLVRGAPLVDAAASLLVAPEVHRLQALELRARELRLSAQFALGRYAEVVDGARALLRDHPYQEGLWSLYARGLAACGDRAAAAAAIDDVRAVLSERFGVDLSRHLAELEAALHESAFGSARAAGAEAATAAETPASPDQFIPLAGNALVGRDVELRSLLDLIDAQRLISLVGPGGAGKTRLAAELVHAAPATRIPCWCALDQATTSDEVVASIRAATTSPHDVAPGGLEGLVGAIAEKAVLLVLDTCERVGAATAAIAAHLLAACPNLSILATSRQPLHHADEWVFRVRPLPFGDRLGSPPDRPLPDRFGPEPLMDAATELLWRCYLDAGGSDSLSEREVDKLARLAALVEGLPLALELLAHRLAAHGFDVPVDVAAGVVDLDAFEGCATLGGGPERHTTMRRAIDWSYSALSTDEQVALRALADLTEPFTFASASAKLKHCSESTSSHLTVVAQLVDRSMLEVTHVAGPSLFRIPDVLRSFVIERGRQGRMDANRGRAVDLPRRRRQSCPLLADGARA